jgi:acyl-CoA thioester hydrolase
MRATRDDIDELGHVSNLVYVRWVQDVAKAHSAAAGWGHARYVEEGGVFVVRRHELDYLAPTFEGDELRALTWIAKWSAVTCERHTRIERVEGGKPVLAAVTTWVFVSTANGAPRRVPRALIDQFEANVAAT